MNSHAIHHPALGKLTVVIEPAVVWQIVEDDDVGQKIVLTWEDEFEDVRHKAGARPGDHTQLLDILKDELASLEQDIRHEEDEVIRESLERDIAAQKHAIRMVELNHDEGDGQETS